MNDVEREFLRAQAHDIEATSRDLLDIIQAFETLRIHGPSAILSELGDRLRSNVSHINYIITKKS